MKKTPDIVFEPEAPRTRSVFRENQGRFRLEDDDLSPEALRVKSFHDITYEPPTSVKPVILKLNHNQYQSKDEVIVFDRYNARHITGIISGINPRKNMYLVKNDREKFAQWCSGSIENPTQYVIKNKKIAA